MPCINFSENENILGPMGPMGLTGPIGPMGMLYTRVQYRIINFQILFFLSQMRPMDPMSPMSPTSLEFLLINLKSKYS